MAFSEYYCDPVSGNNLNGGFPIGGSYPFVSTNGAFTQGGGAGGTDRFTASSGTPFATIADGDFVSVFPDAAAAPTGFVGRVTAHTNTTLDISLTAIAGTRPTTAASGITARVGGAWLGPTGASGFPFGFVTATLTNVAGDSPRVNGKGTSNITAAMTHALIGPVRFQGYTTTPGDGGRWIIDGGTSGVSYTLLTLTNVAVGCDLVDTTYQNNGATGTAMGLSVTVAGGLIRRVVVNSVRGTGLNTNASGLILEECEFYACHQSNTGPAGGLVTSGSSISLTRCFFHDNVGGNARGIYATSGTSVLTVQNCIFDSNGNAGIDIQGNNVSLNARNCDFYNNGNSGILYTNGAATPVLLTMENCNLLKNGAAGIKRTGIVPIHGTIRNCGFGSGNQANTGGTISGMGSVVESGTITYPADTTPWVNPDAGDFRVNLAVAKGTGRGAFTQTQGGYAGTTSYPDVGAAQHLDTSTLVFNTQNVVRFTLKDKTTGQGKTGLSSTTAGLVISTICDNEASAVAYTQAGSTIETIATLGTFAAPTASKCRFREVDATNNKGLYEFQFADSRYAISNAKKLVVSVNDAESTLLDADYEIPLTPTTNVNVTTWAGNPVSYSGAPLVQLAASVAHGGGTATFTGDILGNLYGAVNLIRKGTAQAGTSTNITLDSGASSVSNSYKGSLVWIMSGTGAGQTRTITGYSGTTKIATVDYQWVTNPDNTSVFAILANESPALNTNLAVVSQSTTTVISTDVARAGSTANTIVLALAASSTNNVYTGNLINLTSGTGAGQSRTIVAYNGATQIATVDRNWNTIPDTSSGYNILASTTPSSFSDQGVAQAATSTSITLAATASASDGLYVGSLVTILSGTGAGQTREITAYAGSTRIATIDTAWAVNPDSTSAYAVIPTQSGSGAAPAITNVNVLSWAGSPVSTGAAPLVELADPGPIWDVVNADHLTSGSTGAALSSAASGNIGGGTASGVWVYSTNLTMADPGAGKVRTNAATAAATTQVALDSLTNAGGDVGNLMRQLVAGDLIFAQDYGDSTRWARFSLTAPPADQSGWWLLSVTSTGGQGSPLTNNDKVEIAFEQAGIVPSANQNADALLARNIAGGSSAGRTVGQAMASLRNKVAFDVPAVGQFTVFGTDDTTVLYTGTYTRSNVQNLTAVDPA